jgi:hypothetical protein
MTLINQLYVALGLYRYISQQLLLVELSQIVAFEELFHVQKFQFYYQ